MKTSYWNDIFVNSVAVFIGSLAVQLALALFGAYLGKFITQAKTIKILNIASGLGIILLGCSHLL